MQKAIFVCTLTCLPAALLAQRELNPDQVFQVSRASRVTASYIGPASSNDRGDIVVHVRDPDSTYRALAFLREDQKNNDGSTSAKLVRDVGRPILGRTPTINANRSVALNWRSRGLGRVWRSDFVNGAFTGGARIAEADVTRANAPFDLVSPVVDLTDALLPSTTVAFYGEKGQDRSAYFSAIDLRSPLNAPTIAGSRRGFTALDAQIAVSGNGNAVLRGTAASGSGVYAWLGNALVPIATNRTTPAFTATTRWSSVNDLGTVTFANTGTGDSAVWLSLPGRSVRRAGSIGFPATSPSIGTQPAAVSVTTRIASNDLNQTAFLGTNQRGKQALFSTNLGAIREVVAVDNVLVFGSTRYTVTAIDAHDSLNDHGQIAATLAVTDASNQTDRLIARFDRAPSQLKTRDTVIRPSWQAAGTGYLLRSVPTSQGGVPTKSGFTLAGKGCNLTSTVTVLSYFGFDVTPGQFQNWLLRGWELTYRYTGRINNEYVRHSYLGGTRVRYVNDFTESVVEPFSQVLAVFSGRNDYVRFAGIHRNEPTRKSNFQAILDELRAGRPVKLRVPNRRWQSNPVNKFGHYIVVYGLLDPSRADSTLTLADLLAHDPGHGGIQTLADYGRAMAAAPNWIEDNRVGDRRRYRVYKYERVSTTATPARPQLHITSAAPVRILLRDRAGRRLGTTSAAEFEEIPGGQSFAESPYTTLDNAVPMPAWDGDQPLRHLLLDGAAVDRFEIDVTGQGNSDYSVVVAMRSASSTQSTVLTGSIRTGQTIRHRIVVRPRGFIRMGTSTPACNGEILTTANAAPSPGNSGFRVELEGGPPSAAGALLIGAANPQPVRVAGLRLYLDPTQAIFAFGASTDRNGSIRYPLPLPGHLARGAEVGLQFVFQNPTACSGSSVFSASHGTRLVVQ